ncbi:hypothetical protein MSSAC_1982 [Methanosarcina siciliae C2J]|uniref:Uncharacterized protein n=1 Tax=Methanosarcina siciliae C2J TaxID=1434118 RepID=A0A0E3PPS6_9EURY|nr:hypothetical protein MSSAC_1982 [Methanosarcina siciliae C2J]
MPLVHEVRRLLHRGGIVVGDDERDDLDPPIERTGGVDVDVDRLVRDHARHVVPHEVVARDPVLVVVDHLVRVMFAAAQCGVVIAKRLPGVWVQDILKRGVIRLCPRRLIYPVAVPVELVGDGERFIVLHVPAVRRDIQPCPYDIPDCRLRQVKRLGHDIVPPVRCGIGVEPQIAGHRPGLDGREGFASDPLVRTDRGRKGGNQEHAYQQAQPEGPGAQKRSFFQQIYLFHQDHTA